MAIKPYEEAIVRSLHTYHLLTAEQLCRIHYSPGSHTYVEARLKEMTEKKLLHRLSRSSMNFPYVYMLGIRGIRYLRALGLDVLPLHPSEHTEKSTLFLDHILTTNDVLIAAAQLPRLVPDIQVAEMKHDLTLRRDLKNSIVPDGWIDFRIPEKTQVCIWLEVDRGTMEQKRLRQKITALLRFINTDYAGTFGTPSLTIAFATTAGQRRCDQLCEWIEKELLTSVQKERADLFCIAPLPDRAIEPKTLFVTPIWQVPFQTEPVSLIEYQAGE
jgi:hypothetical protein